MIPSNSLNALQDQVSTVFDPGNHESDITLKEWIVKHENNPESDEEEIVSVLTMKLALTMWIVSSLPEVVIQLLQMIVRMLLKGIVIIKMPHLISWIMKITMLISIIFLRCCCN